MQHEGLGQLLRTYGVRIDNAALKAALDDADQGQAFAEWLQHHLGPDNLLSKDEAEQFAALEKSGQADRLAASQDQSPIPILTDQEIREAIDELNCSTETVAKQTEALRQQQDALARLMRSGGKTSDARADLEFKQTQRWDSEHKRITDVVDDLSQRLDVRAADMEQHGKGLGSHLRHTVDDMLLSDDKLLSSLQKLGWELETEDPEEKDGVAKLREICARLIKYTVETIRTKLDRLYLEALQEARHPRHAAPDLGDDAATLQEEVESLYSEILPVAQMSVEQQYLEPALKSLAGKSGQTLQRSATAISYVHDCLDYLLEHVQCLAERVEAFRAHQAATSTLIQTTRDELAVQVDVQAKRPRAETVSPARRRRSTGPGAAPTPARPRAATTGRRQSALVADEAPLDLILRSLAIMLPEEQATGNPDSAAVSAAEAALSVLSTTLAERTAKMDDVARSVQASFEAGAKMQMADVKRAVAMLRETLLAESPFGAVRLVDPEVESSIAWLTQEVERVRLRLDGTPGDEGSGIEAEVSRLSGRNAKRDEIVERWK